MENNDDDESPYALPEDTQYLPCGSCTPTDVAHVYKLDDGFYREPWDDVVHRGNYAAFGEYDQLLDVFETLEEAAVMIKKYCQSLGESN